MLSLAAGNYEYWHGKNGIFAQQGRASEWILGDDATAEDAMAFVRAQTAASEKVTEAVEELTGNSGNEQQANSEMTQAATGLKTLPADIRQALQGVRFNVYLDGEELNAIIDARLGDSLQTAGP